MRLGIVRTDLTSGIYLQDVENRAQRDFSSQPAGQSRTFKHPTDAQLTAILALYGLLSVRGTDTNATVDTSGGNNILKINTDGTTSYTSITVLSSATAAKTDIAAQLNIGFRNAGLKLSARVDSSNRIVIDTVAPNAGPNAKLRTDSVGGGSTLGTPIGLGANNLTGLSLASLKAAIYPTATTFDVSDATINALSTFSLLSSSQQDALDDAIANVVAPRLVETGPALRSFAYGTMRQLQSSSFRPGGARGGLPAGVAAYVTADDGSTPFTL